MVDFERKVAGILGAKPHGAALVLAPRLPLMPLPFVDVDDPFLPFSKAVIDATKDGVCVYLFNCAAYLALGAAGAVALERAMAYARDDAVTVLDGAFTAGGYAEAAAAFNADALTVRLLEEATTLDHYQQQRDAGVLVYASSAARSSDTLPNLYDAANGLLHFRAHGSVRVLSADVVHRHRRADFAEQLEREVLAYARK